MLSGGKKKIESLLPKGVNPISPSPLPLPQEPAKEIPPRADGLKKCCLDRSHPLEDEGAVLCHSVRLRFFFLFSPFHIATSVCFISLLPLPSPLFSRNVSRSLLLHHHPSHSYSIRFALPCVCLPATHTHTQPQRPGRGRIHTHTHTNRLILYAASHISPPTTHEREVATP